jgi:nucleotide-binding universal stress UspA family protein
MHTISRILVPVDFSPCSRAALDYAAFLGKRFGASIDVLHVWGPPRQLWYPWYTVGPVQDWLSSFERTEAGNEMKSLLWHLENNLDITVRGRLESGDPRSTILSVAAEDHYDLIVMGTHGRTGLSHLLLGSIAEGVVQRAPCPVLTIRTPDHVLQPQEAEKQPDERPRVAADDGR